MSKVAAKYCGCSCTCYFLLVSDTKIWNVIGLYAFVESCNQVGDGRDGHGGLARTFLASGSKLNDFNKNQCKARVIWIRFPRAGDLILIGVTGIDFSLSRLSFVPLLAHTPLRAFRLAT